ncbi:serine/threonine-protein phosphatase [Diaminobutyricibacter tongyongensis]|uniref:Serine/threonine-protein phosphatase n=1 Tax=Leifsonia tongyongensis TaxID=1268043 RepID=A0A6L9Y0C6_9MICO|nr:protein phosphatase 2C domain-containing protein [Diaminobutyricibacter tongyongensis]NEN06728.1 serine/threonine-protein phosphatase [Diaminobutyricibacter tongyongensis]
MTSSVEFWAKTDVGRVRSLNEDSFLARRPVFIVADGLGGHARGDAASQAAIRVFADAFPDDTPAHPDAVVAAIAAANAEVRALSLPDDFGAAVSGTTLVGLVEVADDSGRAWLALNVGDSRLYGWDGQRLEQLSVDHSAVQELYEAGLISAAEMDSHPERNIITRALGAEDDVEADTWILPAEGEHTFLVCSDGLTRELSDDRIAGILAEALADESADPAERLVDAAVAAGGRDNVTVIVVRSRS